MSNAPNILGGGMYNVDPTAFHNGLAGTALPAGNAEIGNYLGNTTQPVQAAASPFVQQAGAGLGALGGQYAALATGQGPSAATVAAQQAGAQNLAASESMLGSTRGAGNPAAAQLAAQNAQRQGAQQVAGNVVAGRTQEELGALGGLGNTYGALGGLGTTVQGQQNQVGLGNQANALGANTNYLGALTGIAGQEQQGQENQQQLANSAYQSSAQMNNKIAGQVLGAASSAAGSLFGV